MAISCLLAQDITRSTSCSYSLPRIDTLYLANYEDVTNMSFNEDDTAISGITMATGTTWYKIEPQKNSASFTDSLQVGNQGNKFRNHNVTFTVGAAYDSDMKKVLDALSLGKFVGVVKTVEGSFLCLGRLGGLEAVENDQANLTGSNDESGMQFTLVCDTTESVTPLTETAISVVTGA